MDYKMEELLPIVAELAQKYTGGESTSVTYERAQSLMEAVIYCLDEYHSVEAEKPADITLSVRGQYEAGVRLLYRKVEEIRLMFNALIPEFEDFGVKCLRDTVQKGIPHFLKWYDIRFCPQDALIRLEYPLLEDSGARRGADAVHHYIQAIAREQRFLRTFDKNEVIRILEEYHPDYREMTENICGILTSTAYKNWH